MCAPGATCGCGGAASALGSGAAIVVAGAVAVGGLVAFLAAHLLVLALAAVALPVATLAVVRYLRRYVLLVHGQAPRPPRQIAVAAPAIARPRPAQYARMVEAQRARAVGAPQARAVGAGSARGIEPRLAGAVGTQQAPALDGPAPAQLAMGGYHLHFHGVSAAEVAALLRRDGDPVILRPQDVAALPGTGDRPRA
jgi:hypothetical protein